MITFVVRRCLPNTSKADQRHSRTPFHLEHLCDFVNYVDPIDEVLIPWKRYHGLAYIFSYN